MQVLNGNFLPTDSMYMKGMTLARTFRVLDSLVLAALVYLGALCFKKVVATEENQLAYCVQVELLVIAPKFHLLCLEAVLNKSFY